MRISWMWEVDFEMSADDLIYIDAKISFDGTSPDPDYKLEWDDDLSRLQVQCLPNRGNWTAPIYWDKTQNSWKIDFHPKVHIVRVHLLVDLHQTNARIQEIRNSADRLEGILSLSQRAN